MNIWRLLRAEAEYHKIYMAIAYSIALPAMAVAILVAGGVESALQTPNIFLIASQVLLLSLVFPVILGITADRRNSKRTRLWVQTAVPIRKMSFLILIFPLLFWFSLSALFWLIYLWETAGRIVIRYAWNTLSLTGFVFLAAASVLFYDLNYCLRSRASRRMFNILGPLGLSAALLLFFIVILPPDSPTSLPWMRRFMLDFGSTPVSSLFMFALGAAGLVVGAMIFSRRRSYTE
jgi:hypothetical protein